MAWPRRQRNESVERLAPILQESRRSCPKREKPPIAQPPLPAEAKPAQGQPGQEVKQLSCRRQAASSCSFRRRTPDLSRRDVTSLPLEFPEITGNKNGSAGTEPPAGEIGRAGIHGHLASRDDPRSGTCAIQNAQFAADRCTPPVHRPERRRFGACAGSAAPGKRPEAQAGRRTNGAGPGIEPWGQDGIKRLAAKHCQIRLGQLAAIGPKGCRCEEIAKVSKVLRQVDQGRRVGRLRKACSPPGIEAPIEPVAPGHPRRRGRPQLISYETNNVGRAAFGNSIQHPGNPAFLARAIQQQAKSQRLRPPGRGRIDAPGGRFLGGQTMLARGATLRCPRSWFRIAHAFPRRSSSPPPLPEPWRASSPLLGRGACAQSPQFLIFGPCEGLDPGALAPYQSRGASKQKSPQPGCAAGSRRAGPVRLATWRGLQE